jgi:HTH-type transcriptional regulator/antitoxin HigA
MTIRTEKEYALALARISELEDADEDSPEGEELDTLSLLVEEYEDKYYPVDEPVVVDEEEDVFDE